MAKQIAIHRISHRIMDLEEEGVGITPIEEKKGGRCNHNGGQQQFSSQATQNFSPQNFSP